MFFYILNIFYLSLVIVLFLFHFSTSPGDHPPLPESFCQRRTRWQFWGRSRIPTALWDKQKTLKKMQNSQGADRGSKISEWDAGESNGDSREIYGGIASEVPQPRQKVSLAFSCWCKTEFSVRFLSSKNGRVETLSPGDRVAKRRAPSLAGITKKFKSIRFSVKFQRAERRRV